MRAGEGSGFSRKEMFSSDELRRHIQARGGVHGSMNKVRFPRLAVLVVCLVPSVFRLPAFSQTILDDLVIRAFDIDVSIAPVPMKYEFEGGQLRFTSHGTLRGTTTAMVEVTAPSPVSTARFFFDSDLKLISVKTPDYQVASERQRDTLTLTFTPALSLGSKVPVTFHYEGQPLYIFDEFVMVSEGSLYPLLISPFGDFSANLARVTLKLTTPGGYNIAGTGKLLAREGGVLTWDTEVPVPWVAVAGGRKHTVRDKTVGGVTMQFYVPPGEDRNLDKLADFTGRSIDFYSKLLYQFPYSELRAVSLFIVSGGIGYPAFLLIDDRAFRNTFTGDLNRDSFLFHLMAHEAAHSYVPSQTVPKGVGFIWLSEGFAEYLSLMAVEALLGPDAFKRELQEERDNYALVAATAVNEPSIASLTFANYHGRAATTVIYAKGSLVLHMLRGVLGDEVFKTGLAAYFREFRGRSARVADFQEAMERAAGQSLDWFFREWIQDKVLPDYTVTQVKSVPTAEGAFQTTAIVRNLGTGQMPVEVGFIMDGDIQIQRVEIASGGEVTVTATTQKPVKQVEVDPQKWVIQKDYKNDVARVK